MYSLLSTLVLVFCVAWADGQYQDRYVYNKMVGGSFKLHPEADWKTARVKCYEEGAVLASPESDEMWAHMTSWMPPPDRVFIGIHDTYSKGYFQTINGMPYKRKPVHWVLGQTLPEPDKTTGPSCMTMQSNGILGYAKCNQSFPFFCYKREPTCGPQDNGYKYEGRSRSCYKVFKHRLPWWLAFAVCASDDAHLAIINSETEVEVLKGLLHNVQFDEIHLGFSDWRGHSMWMTIDGQSLKDAGYEKWNSNEPNNKNNEQYCGAMVANGLLDDVNCNREPYFFICEKQPDGSISNFRK